MENSEVVRMLDEVADMLEISGANVFRIRAYRWAAQVIREYPAPIAALGEDQLGEMPGIGADLAGKIATLVRTGDLPVHRELQVQVPIGLLELRKVVGLGPKRIKLLAELLGIRSRDDLKRAIDAGALRVIPGFGPKMEQRIRAALERLERR